MKHVVCLGLILLCATGIAGFGNKGQKPGGNHQGADAGQGMLNDPAMKKLQAARTLILSADQQARLATLESQVRKQMQALRDEFQQSHSGAGGGQHNFQQLRQKKDEIDRQLTTGLDAILTPQQKTELTQKNGAGGQNAASTFSRRDFHRDAGRIAKQGGPAVTTVQAPPVVPKPVVAMPQQAVTATSGTLGAVNPFTP